VSIWNPTGNAPKFRLIRRRMLRFLDDPPSVRNAASVIVAATTFVTLAAAVAMRVFNAKEFPHLGGALWWSVQTVTTVGYGDLVPHSVFGRILAAVVMLEGIAFLAIITAAITSTFVARAERELHPEQAILGQRLDEFTERLDRIEQLLTADHPHRTMAPPPGGA
jgi:voltage-gated potassium channel